MNTEQKIDRSRESLLALIKDSIVSYSQAHNYVTAHP